MWNICIGLEQAVHLLVAEEEMRSGLRAAKSVFGMHYSHSEPGMWMWAMCISTGF